MDTTVAAAPPPRIAIVTGARPGALNETVGRWVCDIARRRGDANVSRVDVGGQRLRLVEAPASLGHHASEHVQAWARTVAAFDGFVFVTPEYNEASSALLKDAIHLVARQWRNKAAGFVGYGAGGAVRAIEDLRLTLAEVGAATVLPQISLTLVPGFWKRASFLPDPRHAPEMESLIDQVITWGSALKTVRIAVGQEREGTASLTGWPASERRFRAQ